MKNIRFLILGLAAAFCAPTRYTTANAAESNPSDVKSQPSAEITALQKQMDALKAENEQFKLRIENMTHDHREALEGAGRAFQELNAQLKQSKSGETPNEEADTSILGLAAKGAGVPLSDVKWRVAAGLTPDQAVQAALNQKKAEAAKVKRLADAKKAEKSK